MKVKRSSFIFFTISLLGFGKERKRWLKSGRIRVFTTVILPMMWDFVETTVLSIVSFVKFYLQSLFFQVWLSQYQS
jgi:hypothetical protein